MSIDQRLGRGLIGHSLSAEKQFDRQPACKPADALNCKIQFVPARVSYSWRSSMIKTKYSNFGSVRSPTVVTRPLDSFDDRSKSSPGSTSSASDSLPIPQFEIFPADEIRLTWNTEKRIGTSVGLQNLGNTCFMNSILQVLVNTPPIVNYLTSNMHNEQHCPSQTGFCAICSLHQHVKRVMAFQMRNDILSPSYIAQKIRCMMKSHTWGSQEDAHEFLRYFVDSMQTAALHPYKDKKLDMFTKETTAISRIFGGFHRSQIICNNCQFVSVTYDPFLDLSLEIKQWNSVESALAHYTRMETLSNENAYLCPRCKKRVSAKKILTIHTAPNVLTVHLKRFDHIGKIDRQIAYTERLNLRPYMTEKQGLAINYRLYAVVVHNGRSTNSGHYYAFVRNSFGQWHLMDDSRVCAVSNENPLKASAYLLFYLRMPTPIMATVKPQAKVEENKSVGELLAAKDVQKQSPKCIAYDDVGMDRKKISFKINNAHNNGNRSVKMSRISPFKIKLKNMTNKEHVNNEAHLNGRLVPHEDDSLDETTEETNSKCNSSPVSTVLTDKSVSQTLSSSSSSSPLLQPHCTVRKDTSQLFNDTAQKSGDQSLTQKVVPLFDCVNGKRKRRRSDEDKVISISKSKRSPSARASDKRHNMHRFHRDGDGHRSVPDGRKYWNQPFSNHRHHGNRFRSNFMRPHSGNNYAGQDHRKSNGALNVFRKQHSDNVGSTGGYNSQSFGSAVKSWNGEMNSIDRSIVEQQMLERSRRHDSDDERDYRRTKERRRRKLAKRYRDGERNCFQRVQDGRNRTSSNA